MPQPQLVPKTASSLTDMAIDIFAKVMGVRGELEISEQACQTMCEVVEEVVNRWAVAAVETGEGSAQTEECVTEEPAGMSSAELQERLMDAVVAIAALAHEKSLTNEDLKPVWEAFGDCTDLLPWSR